MQLLAKEVDFLKEVVLSLLRVPHSADFQPFGSTATVVVPLYYVVIPLVLSNA